MKGAPLGRLHGGIVSRIARQNDDLRLRPFLLYFRKQVQPIGVRQIQVQDNDVRLRLGKRLLECGAVFRHRDLVAGPFEDKSQKLADFLRIIDDQYFRLHKLFFRFRSQARVKLENIFRCSGWRVTSRSG